MINASTKVLVAMALGFVVLSTTQGFKAYRVLVDKAQAQTEVTESVHRWRQNYMALGESVKRWEHDYRRQDSVPDLMSLFAVINMGDFGLIVNTDSMILNKIEPATQNGMPIGLTKVCLASSGSGDASALEVQAPNYQALFSGIKRLSQRDDIFIGTISIKGDKPVPVAELGEFCVLLSK